MYIIFTQAKVKNTRTRHNTNIFIEQRISSHARVIQKLYLYGYGVTYVCVRVYEEVNKVQKICATLRRKEHCFEETDRPTNGQL